MSVCIFTVFGHGIFYSLKQSQSGILMYICTYVHTYVHMSENRHIDRKKLRFISFDCRDDENIQFCWQSFLSFIILCIAIAACRFCSRLKVYLLEIPISNLLLNFFSQRKLHSANFRIRMHCLIISVYMKVKKRSRLFGSKLLKKKFFN
jgi:hypothetical protein